MSVFYQDPAVQLLHGDVLAMLQTLPDNYVQTVVTSPPYFAIRDYKVKGQLGLERTPDAYIDKLVSVFREVRRVLRKDGTLWLNIGDCYNSGTTRNRVTSTLQGSHGYWTNPHIKMRVKVAGIKTKDMLGIPWSLALALRADGWYLRCDVIWDKPNAAPESSKDRPTKTHDYLFLLSKSSRYYYDHVAVQEKCSPNTHARISQKNLEQQSRGSKQRTGVTCPDREDRDRTPTDIHKAMRAKLGVSPKQASGSREIGTKTQFWPAVRLAGSCWIRLPGTARRCSWRRNSAVWRSAST